MSEQLAASYLSTELVFDFDSHGAWVLRPEGVGANPPKQLAKLNPPEMLVHSLGLEHPALVITASNPKGNVLDDNLNNLRNTRLFWSLKDLGLETVPCLGRSINTKHEERSFWVPTRGVAGIDLAVQEEARKFGQNAIFRVRPGELELVGVEIPDLSGSTPVSWWQAGAPA